MFLQCPLILCSPFAANNALSHSSISKLTLWAIYQILDRRPEPSSDIHVKPGTVLRVCRSRALCGIANSIMPAVEQHVDLARRPGRLIALSQPDSCCGSLCCTLNARIVTARRHHAQDWF